MKKVLTLALAFVMVITSAVSVFAADTFVDKARATIKAELAKYGVAADAFIDSLNEDQLREIQKNQDMLSDLAADTNAKIKAAASADEVTKIVNDAYAQAKEALDAAKITVKIGDVEATATGFKVEIDGTNTLTGATATPEVTITTTPAGNTPGTNTPAGTTQNPLGTQTGDAGVALALLCFAVVGGVLAVGAVKSRSVA